MCNARCLGGLGIHCDIMIITHFHLFTFYCQLSYISENVFANFCTNERVRVKKKDDFTTLMYNVYK